MFSFLTGFFIGQMLKDNHCKPSFSQEVPRLNIDLWKDYYLELMGK